MPTPCPWALDVGGETDGSDVVGSADGEGAGSDSSGSIAAPACTTRAGGSGSVTSPIVRSARRLGTGGTSPPAGPNRMLVAITTAHATATSAKAAIAGRCWGERSSESSLSGFSSMPGAPPRPECVGPDSRATGPPDRNRPG